MESPFFLLAPEWALIPLVILATFATIVASQALISGVFSLTNQGMQLGFIPRLEVRHTSADVHGQIYLPAVNWTLLVACLGLVAWLSIVGQPGRRVWPRSHRDHGPDDDAARGLCA